MSKAPEVTDATFEKEVLQANDLVLVDFWAEWCGPCKVIGPTIDAMASEHQSKMKVMKMDVDQNPETPAKYRVRGIPTLLMFKGGELVDQLVGAHPRETIENTVRKHGVAI